MAEQNLLGIELGIKQTVERAIDPIIIMNLYILIEPVAVKA